MTPDATPREAIYIETGLLDIQTLAESKRMNMKARLNREKSDMMARILDNPECMWERDTLNTMTKYGITPEDLAGSKYHTKTLIKKAVMNKFKPAVELASQGKSKMAYFLDSKTNWQSGKRAQYMNELTRKQSSLIFKARCRMIKVKGNYKNGYPDLTCRLCGSEEESQTHILETCHMMHPDDTNKVSKLQLFSENADALRLTAKKIDKIMEKLSELVY